MRVVALGVTRGMGRSLARLLAERGDRLFLLGRDAADLGRTAADLIARTGRSEAVAGQAVCDLADAATFAPALEMAVRALGSIDLLLITAARFATQRQLEADPELARALVTVNYANTIALCEQARPLLLANGGGTLCVFSSVAGDRPRSRMAIYGSAKAGLSAYLEGLDHRYRDAGLRVVCVKPGFVKTGMTAGLTPPPFAGEPFKVAHAVLHAIDRRQPVVYAPAIWRWIMLIIRHLPRRVMRQMKF